MFRRSWMALATAPSLVEARMLSRGAAPSAFIRSQAQRIGRVLIAAGTKSN